VKNLMTKCALGLSCLLTFTAMPALGAAYLVGGGINQGSSSLPPSQGGYVSPADVHACFAVGGGTACVEHGNHFGFDLTDTQEVNGNQVESFNSHFSGLMSFQGNNFAITLTGPVQIQINGRPDNTTLGEFSTEMLSMVLSGTTPLGPIQIRESPTLASLGSTKITDNGNGTFHIDSFFDVFTELSVDGGQSWHPSTTGAARVDLVDSPEPGTWFLVSAALIGVGAIRRRKLQ
jgi:hypothetical protein